MNLESKAAEFANSLNEATINEKMIIKSSFIIGYRQCKDDIIEFLKVNQKATVKQVLEHLNGMK